MLSVGSLESAWSQYTKSDVFLFEHIGGRWEREKFKNHYSDFRQFIMGKSDFYRIFWRKSKNEKSNFSWNKWVFSKIKKRGHIVSPRCIVCACFWCPENFSSWDSELFRFWPKRRDFWFLSNISSTRTDFHEIPPDSDSWDRERSFALLFVEIAQGVRERVGFQNGPGQYIR